MELWCSLPSPQIQTSTPLKSTVRDMFDTPEKSPTASSQKLVKKQSKIHLSIILRTNTDNIYFFKLHSTFVAVFIDRIKTTFHFNFGFLPSFKHPAHKHKTKRSCQLTTSLLIAKKLVRNQSLNRKIVFFVLI